VKAYILILFTFFLCCTPISAQDNVVVNYLQHAGDYAEIYNGRLEEIYNVVLYENFPYYMNDEFTDASIVYRNNYYPNQKVRLDLYREQLIVLPPENRHGIILSSQNVQKVMMYGKTFVWLTPAKESGLKAGYYIQLLDRDKMKLFSKETCSLEKNQLEKNQFTYDFSHKIRYYLFYNNQYYPVKNKNLFLKLFPQHKKQINQFAKSHKLNFKKNADESFTSLAGYCEELITSTNKQ